MAETKPTGLGDEPVNAYKTIHESFPLPEGGRKGLLALIERVLSVGGVQKLVLEFNKPIQLWRMVKKAEVSEEVPDELLDDDLMGAVRNSPMEEFVFSDLEALKMSVYEYLFQAFALIDERHSVAKALMVSSQSEAQAWFGLTKKVTSAFGVAVIPHKEIPDGGALLVACQPDDPAVITFSLRLDVNLPAKRERK